MAERRRRTDEILVFDTAGRNKAPGSGCCRKTTVDYRTGLSGTETGTRVGPLRRPRLARLPPSCDAMHCRLRVPGRGAEPFFPLSPGRLSRITSPRTSARLPAPGLASDPSGIIYTQSLH